MGNDDNDDVNDVDDDDLKLGWAMMEVTGSSME